MMKITFIITFLCFLISSFTFAQDSVERQCEDQALRFGNGKGSDWISTGCFDHYKKNAYSNKEHQGPQNLYGLRNLIFVEPSSGEKNKVQLIAGYYTKLTDVIDLIHDEKNDEILVLEKSGDIYTYNAKVLGNVMPMRILKANEISGATKIAVNTKNDEIIALNNDTNSIVFFSRLANIKQRPGKRKLELIRSVDGISTTIVDMDFNNELQELYLLDSGKNSILVYAPDSNGKYIKKREISGSKTLLSTPLKIFIKDNKINIINNDAKVLKFDISANGDIAPTI